MNRRNFTNKLSLGLGAAALLSARPKAGNEPEFSRIVHYVLFWLKEGLSEKEVNDFTQFFEELKRIPGIVSLKYGKPAKTNPRPVVDNSFSYNLIVTFENLEAVNVYEHHPIHLNAIEKFKHLWTKVVVHDSFFD